MHITITGEQVDVGEPFKDHIKGIISPRGKKIMIIQLTLGSYFRVGVGNIVLTAPFTLAQQSA